VRGRGWGTGAGGKMALTMYAYMNKLLKKNKEQNKKTKNN
jgi:hypothetical protein